MTPKTDSVSEQTDTDKDNVIEGEYVEAKGQDGNDLYDVKEASKFLGISERQIYRLLKDNEIERADMSWYTKRGKKPLRFEQTELERVKKERETTDEEEDTNVSNVSSNGKSEKSTESASYWKARAEIAESMLKGFINKNEALNQEIGKYLALNGEKPLALQSAKHEEEFEEVQKETPQEEPKKKTWLQKLGLGFTITLTVAGAMFFLYMVYLSSIA